MMTMRNHRSSRSRRPVGSSWRAPRAIRPERPVVEPRLQPADDARPRRSSGSRTRWGRGTSVGGQAVGAGGAASRPRRRAPDGIACLSRGSSSTGSSSSNSSSQSAISASSVARPAGRIWRNAQIAATRLARATSDDAGRAPDPRADAQPVADGRVARVDRRQDDVHVEERRRPTGRCRRRATALRSPRGSLRARRTGKGSARGRGSAGRRRRSPAASRRRGSSAGQGAGR